MKAVIGAMLVAAAMQVQAQGLEADLDGNASALQASEMRPAQKSTRVTQIRRKNDQRRERVASR